MANHANAATLPKHASPYKRGDRRVRLLLLHMFRCCDNFFISPIGTGHSGVPFLFVFDAGSYGVSAEDITR